MTCWVYNGHFGTPLTGNFSLRTPHWPAWDFLRVALACEALPTQSSVQLSLQHRCQVHMSLKAPPTYSDSLPIILHKCFPQQIFYMSNPVLLSAPQWSSSAGKTNLWWQKSEQCLPQGVKDRHGLGRDMIELSVVMITFYILKVVWIAQNSPNGSIIFVHSMTWKFYHRIRTINKYWILVDDVCWNTWREVY